MTSILANNFIRNFHLQVKRTADTEVSGLPDGIFSYQNFPIGYIFEGLGMETVVIFYGHLLILCFFGLFFLVYTTKNLATLNIHNWDSVSTCK
jgi:hypothetical protein